MTGRGARTIPDTDFQAVTPDAKAKTHFIIVDAVGLSQEEMSDTQPLDRKKSVSLDKLMEAVTFGSRDKDVFSSIASRLARLNNKLSMDDQKLLIEVNHGKPLADITRAIVAALDPDVQIEAARQETGKAEPDEKEVQAAADRLLAEAGKAIATNPVLRQKIIEIRKSYEQTIDTSSKDELTFAGIDDSAKGKAKSIISSFEKFIAENKDEITALQVLYSKPYQQRLTFKQIKELADTLSRPRDGARGLTPEVLWHAYETLDRSRVHGSGGRMLTDIVSLVRFALKEQPELHPFRDDVNARFSRWIASQEKAGKLFTAEQMQWLEAIRDHVASSLTIEMDDFDLAPFDQRGGLGKAYQVFGDRLQPLLSELNEVLAA
jgi:type I restriction enzyme R subunit